MGFRFTIRTYFTRIHVMLWRNDWANRNDSFEIILSETLRKYPPLSTLNRVVTKPYVIPGTNIKLKTGTKIIIPAHALHFDSKYYPDPDDFDPERFSDENMNKIHPNTYMPFGDGPRFCIGMSGLLNYL